MSQLACPLLVLLLLTAVPPAGAAGGLEQPIAFHVRVVDARLRTLIGEGLRRSPTFRSIVDRLAGTDVIVHLHIDTVPAPGADGRLTFASKAGGYRYVIVRLRRQATCAQMLGLVAHELRHAVEVAEMPAIVDSPSLAREYTTRGHFRRATADGLTFDTQAAVDAGYRVLAEMSPERPSRTRPAPVRASRDGQLSADIGLAP